MQSVEAAVRPGAVADSSPVKDAVERPSGAGPILRGVLAWSLAPMAAVLALLLHKLLPDRQSPNPTQPYPVFLLGVLGLLLLIAATTLALGFFFPALKSRLASVRSTMPLLAVAILLLALWDLITLKMTLLPQPYFPWPDKVLQSFLDDWRELADCAWHSLLLLMGGYFTGVLAGLVCGVMIGWSARVRYWGMPVLKSIGPLPATAWIPLAMLLCGQFGMNALAAMLIIAMAVWFPVTMLTISGISNVRVSYLDVARTLGAGRFYLIFRVAIPAAMPSIFIGLFMGLSASFLTLVVAEGIGVSSGLAWYADTARSGMEYSKIWASLIITALFFSIIMTLLFKVRDRILVWQKGVIKW